MDVESQKTLDEGIDRAHAAVEAALDKLSAAIAGDEAEAIAEIRAVLAAAQTALASLSHAALQEAITGLHGVLDRLNGMTLTVSIPPRKAS